MTTAEPESPPRNDPAPRDFIRDIVADDLASGKHSVIVTRFPPEPNGRLHIGHAKAICLNFGVAADAPGGRCHLRFDDTNPAKEDVAFERGIIDDMKWLGFDWGEHLYYASDYFERMYQYAEQLIEAGKAYVDSQSAEDIRASRGTLKEPGRASPYRDRSVEENLDLFRRMRAGEFPDGSHVLRAKIDMAAPNINLRDPTLYRIRRVPHYRTGDTWCIYPMYDYAHCLEDSIEGVTHSLCSLEFENNRPLYDWFLDTLQTEHHPRQIEFGRMSLNYTVMSKRQLRTLVEEGHVAGWDDPRMPTLVGMRRRGYPPEVVRGFLEAVGVAKRNATVDIARLEHMLRDHLNRVARRYLAVLRPLRVVIENYPEGQVEELEAVNNPEDPGAGTRSVPFSKVLYIEQDDFMEDPPRKFFRMTPGREVRLRYAYLVTCTDVVKDDDGNIVEVRCTYDPQTRGGSAPDGRKVKGTLHWVSAERAVDAEVRLYDRLFSDENPAGHDDREFHEFINAESLEVIEAAKVEPALATLPPETRVQFERLGYFTVDPDATTQRPVFNRIVTLRDAWAKLGKGT